MKKTIAALFAALFLVLSGCGDSSMDGEVISAQDGYLVLDGEGEQFALRLTENVAIFEPDSGFPGTQLDIRGARRDGSVEYGSESIRAYTAESAMVTGELKRGVLHLDDGTEIDVMRTNLFGDRYRLSDGTELLCEDISVSAGNTPPAKVAGKIESYFEDNRPYDLSALLEAAYAEYSANPEDFAYHSVTLNVMPSALSERAAYFRASLSVANVVHSDNSRTGEYEEFGCAFDRETGEKLDTRSLFSTPWDEARETLVAAAQVSDSDRAQRMADALEPDGVCITDDGITISFPAGAVGELSLSAYIERENLPDGLLQSWAEPEAWSETE